MIYIASPYTHEDVAVLVRRFQLAAAYAGSLMCRGRQCFSPIAYGHQFHLFHNLPIAFEYWQDFNDRILLACDEVHVLRIPGFEESRGVAHEIEMAERHGIPVRYVNP